METGRNCQFCDSCHSYFSEKQRCDFLLGKLNHLPGSAMFLFVYFVFDFYHPVTKQLSSNFMNGTGKSKKTEISSPSQVLNSLSWIFLLLIEVYRYSRSMLHLLFTTCSLYVNFDMKYPSTWLRPQVLEP